MSAPALSNPPDRARYYRLLWAIVAFGLLLRLVEYLECRSLWLDEAFLSLNIIQKPLAGLFHPLDYKQGAPIAFLVAQKLSVLVFGPSEYGLRLIPLMAGVIALIAFARLVQTEFAPLPALVATTLFAVADPLIHYSAEAKQYSCDATVNTLLLLAALSAMRHGFDRRHAILLGLTGAFAVFFSHPAVFVLGGIGLTLSCDFVLLRRWNRLRSLALVFTSWALGFALCYAVNLRYLTSDTFFDSFWSKDFLPSLFDIAWLQRFGISRYLDFLALAPRNLPLYILLALGMIRLARVKPALLAFILTPIGLALVASVLHKYPLFERFLVFIVPSSIILLAAGIAVLSDLAGRWTPNAGRALATVLLIYPVAHGAATLWTPRNVQDFKPVLAYVQAHRQPDDLVYVSQLAAYPFKYYASRYGFYSGFQLPSTYVDQDLGKKYANGLKRRYDEPGFNPLVLGYCSYFTTTSEADLLDDLKALQGAPRVWVLCSHGGGEGEANIQARTTKLLDAEGVRLDTFERPGLWGGSAAYLYDLSRKPAVSTLQ